MIVADRLVLRGCFPSARILMRLFRRRSGGMLSLPCCLYVMSYVVCVVCLFVYVFGSLCYYVVVVIVVVVVAVVVVVVVYVVYVFYRCLLLSLPLSIRIVLFAAGSAFAALSVGSERDAAKFRDFEGD